MLAASYCTSGESAMNANTEAMNPAATAAAGAGSRNDG
jgi:hypothetical protein